MLTRHLLIRNRGFSLVELSIVLVIISIVSVLGFQSYQEWARNSQVRVAAESLQAGLQLARVEALKRNASIRFQLVSTFGDDCELVSTGSNWIVSAVDPSGNCNASATVLRQGGGGDGTPDVQFLMPEDETLLTFNGLGRLPSGVGSFAIDVKNVKGTCAHEAGNGSGVRCMRLQIDQGGQVRMCDPKASDDVRKC